MYIDVCISIYDSNYTIICRTIKDYYNINSTFILPNGQN